MEEVEVGHDRVHRPGKMEPETPGELSEKTMLEKMKIEGDTTVAREDEALHLPFIDEEEETPQPRTVTGKKSV